MLLLLPFLAAGLVSYPARTLGPELQHNGGFESGLDRWTAGGYALDTEIRHGGRASLRLDGADRIPYAQSASQLLPGKSGPGFYRLTAWIKTQELGANGKGKGARIGVRAKEAAGQAYCGRGCGFSQVYSGTADWSKVELESVYLTDPSLGILVISDAYAEPSGAYWLDDIVVQEEKPAPLDVALRVPNYRGILWSDQPSVAEFDVTQYNPGAITATVQDETGPSQTLPARSGRTKLDLSAFPGTQLTVTWRVNGQPAFPPYRLVRKPAAERSQMTVTFSPDGRFLVRGKPTFLLGVYDSGIGYTTTQAGWVNSLTTSRRLFELPGLNGYINYWFGGTPTNSVLPLMDALHARGILYWQTANCFASSRYGGGKVFPGTGPDPSYATTLGRHPGLGGWYLADECVAGLADDVFADHQLLQERDGDGVNLGVFNQRDVRPWLPSVDVIGVDEYPLYGAEPAGGYPLGKVYDGAHAVRQAVGPERPFWQVIQFFKFTSRGRWPTKDELRSMSYAAIVGGANGLFFWSLGTNALAYSCSSSAEWCPEKVEYFERLKSVFAELSSLAALSNPDLPSSSVAVSDRAIKIRVKQGAGDTDAYVLAFNDSNHARTVTLTMANTSRTNGPVTASFGPWGAQVIAVP